MKWEPQHCIAVLCAIDNDKGFEANMDILCPVCNTNNLYYDRTSMFDMTAWCRKCEAGLRQGNGSANEGKLEPVK